MPSKLRMQGPTQGVCAARRGPQAVARDPRLAHALERLVDPVTRGDPMGPLLWTCSSAARLAGELQTAGHPVSERTPAVA